MPEFRIRDLAHLAVLGRALASCLREAPSLRCILLRGDLGSGKTTLTRLLVNTLPGGDRAEISSPSFTLCNVYPTTPPVCHCDLFRAGSAVPDEISEILDAGDMAMVVEWAEHLPVAWLPHEFLDICLQVCEDSILVRIEIHSPNSAQLAVLLQVVQSI